MVHVRSTLLFAAILVFVSGLPHGADRDEYQQASTEVNMLLQQGKDQSACADLAKTLVDEVTASVKLSNELLAALPDGSSCPSEGQEAVKAAQRDKDAADKAAREAATAASKASGTEVDFGAFSFSSLTEGKCGQFWEDKAYKSAKAAAAAADSAKTKADAKAKAAAGALDDDTKAAAEAVKACQCQVRKAYDSAWTAANKNNEANQASYTKGKHMECVLEGRAAAECDAGDAPKPNPVTLADGVPAEPCAETGEAKAAKAKERAKIAADPRTRKTKFVGVGVCRDGVKNGVKSFPWLRATKPPKFPGASKNSQRKISWLECKTKALTLKNAIGFSTQPRAPKGVYCNIYFPAPDQPLNCDLDVRERTDKHGSADKTWRCYRNGNKNYTGMKIAFASGQAGSECYKFERENE